MIEKDCFKYLLDIVQPGQYILDVGARIGSYTLFFSKLVGKNGRIFAFEPDPIANVILKKNIKINHLKNVNVETKAISNANGKGELFLPRGGGTTLSTIINYQSDFDLIKTKMIDMTTIDKYCESNKIKPDGIKIDVEGADLLVLEGSIDIINKFSPWI